MLLVYFGAPSEGVTGAAGRRPSRAEPRVP